MEKSNPSAGMYQAYINGSTSLCEFLHVLSTVQSIMMTERWDLPTIRTVNLAADLLSCGASLRNRTSGLVAGTFAVMGCCRIVR
jgi:hypothetical protein